MSCPLRVPQGVVARALLVLGGMLTLDQRSEKARKGQEQNLQIRTLLAGQGATFISNDLQEGGQSILGPIFAE